MNFYKHFLGDYARDTAHLSLTEHGAYRVMLDTYYATAKPLPAEKSALFRIAKAVNACERKAVVSVADQFFPVNGDGFRHNKRADAELEKERQFSASQRDRAARKWGDSAGVGKTNRSERMSAARAIASHTQDQWIAMVSACDSKCVRCGSDGPLVKDHIKPIYQGGSDGIGNIQPLCQSCNSSKGPDLTDLRPPGWPAKMPAGCLPNACDDAYPMPATTAIEKQKKPDGHPSDVWSLGVQMLTDSGIPEKTARTYLGSLRKRFDDETLTHAIHASVGKTEPKAYLAGVLKNYPEKQQKRSDGLAL